MTSTQTVARDSQSTLAPKMRFPEFRREAGWKLTELGKLFSQREETNCTDLRLLSLTDREGIIPQEDSNRKNSASVDRSKYLRVVPGDIAYNTMRMWEGRSALATLEGVVSPAYTVCAPNTDVDSLFFSYYFKTPQLIGQFARYSQGLVKDTLNLKFEAFSGILAATPSLVEQQKIAECLSTLDELIGAESQKLDALKAHKKGLMQQLFPREGETVPCRRFPEFQGAPEWEPLTLIQIARFRRGSFPQPYGLPEWYDEHNGTPFVQVFDVDDNLLLKRETKNKISELASRQSVFIPKGTIVVTLQGSIGRVAITQYDAYVDRTLLLFEEFLVPVDRRFFAYSIQLLFEVEKRSAPGHIIKTITKEVLSDFVVRLPQPPEQQKIASCFSDLDDLIAAQSDKLEALKTHKKGLMQQLFPSPEADA